MLDVQLEECVFCCFWMECSVYSWSLNNMGLTCVGHLYIDFFFFFNYICRTLCARCTEVDSLSLHRHKVSGIYYETNVLVFSLLFNFAFKELYYYTVYLSCRVGNSNPFQYSCLETPVDRGAWWESHRVGQSWSALACMHTLEKELPTHSSSCLENPRHRGAWWAAICGVVQSWTQLKRLSSCSGYLSCNWRNCITAYHHR